MYTYNRQLDRYNGYNYQYKSMNLHFVLRSKFKSDSHQQVECCRDIYSIER
jgi:hypothetical protein